MKRIFSLFFLGLIVSFGIQAQQIKVDFENKVIFPDSLHLPGNTNVSNVLTLLPEILQRPTQSVMDHYDVQINGMSLGNSVDVALLQIQLNDVEKIEVSESPISAYNNNGQGGSISIVLRSKSRSEKPVWGSVGFGALYPLDLLPMANVGYRNDKFTIRGLSLGEVYNHSGSTTTSTYQNSILSGRSVSDKDTRMRTQMNCAYMDFVLNPKNKLKWNVAESYTHNHINTTTDLNAVEKNHSTRLTNFLKYSYLGGRYTLNATLVYNYSPSHRDFDNYTQKHFLQDLTSHNVTGIVELKTQLFRKSNDLHSMELIVGVNGNETWKRKDSDLTQRYKSNSYTEQCLTKYYTYYLMPYFKIELKHRQFMMLATAQWQNYKTWITHQDREDKHNNTYSKYSTDLTAQFIAGWFFTPKHCLRLTASQELERPSDDYLYPEKIFNQELTSYVQGNPYLTPMMSREVGLNYVGDARFGEHSLHFDASLNYNHVTDIVNQELMGGTVPSVGGYIPGTTEQYYSYYNHGTDNIVYANLMAFYSYRCFSVSLTGNVYNAYQTGNEDRYTYYNLSIFPTLTMPHGWKSSLKLDYYSRVEREEGSSLSDQGLASLIVGKEWAMGRQPQHHRLFVGVAGRLSLTGKAEDRTKASNLLTLTRYEMCSNYVGAELKYSF